MSSERDDRKTRPEHAAQLDKLLEENARLRRALEGQIDPALFASSATESRGLVAGIKAVTPRRWHRSLGKVRKAFRR